MVMPRVDFEAKTDGDIPTLPLPLRILVLTTPYSYPILTARAAVTGDYLLATGGIIYVTVFIFYFLIHFLNPFVMAIRENIE